MQLRPVAAMMRYTGTNSLTLITAAALGYEAPETLAGQAFPTQGPWAETAPIQLAIGPL